MLPEKYAYALSICPTYRQVLIDRQRLIDQTRAGAAFSADPSQCISCRAKRECIIMTNGGDARCQPPDFTFFPVSVATPPLPPEVGVTACGRPVRRGEVGIEFDWPVE